MYPGNIDPMQSGGFIPQPSQATSKESEQPPQALSALVEKLQDAFSRTIGPYVGRIEQTLDELRTQLPALSGKANETQNLIASAQSAIDTILDQFRSRLITEHQTELQNLTGNQTETALRAYLDSVRNDFNVQKLVTQWHPVSSSTVPTEGDTKAPLPNLADILNTLEGKSDKEKVAHLCKLLTSRISHQLERLYGEGTSIFNMGTHSKELKKLWDRFFSASTTQSWQSASKMYQEIVSLLKNASKDLPTSSQGIGGLSTPKDNTPPTKTETLAATPSSYGVGGPATVSNITKVSPQNLGEWEQNIKHPFDEFYYSDNSPQGKFIHEIDNWLDNYIRENPTAQIADAQKDLALYLNRTYDASSTTKDLYFTYPGVSQSDATNLYSVLNAQGVSISAPETTPTDNLLLSLLKQPYFTDADKAIQKGMIEALKTYQTDRSKLQQALNQLYGQHQDADSITQIAHSLNLTSPEWAPNLINRLSGIPSSMPQGQFAQTIIQWLTTHKDDPDLAANLAKYLNTQYSSPPSSVKNDLYFTFEGTTHEGLSYKDAQEVYSLLESSGVSVSTPAPTDIDQVLFNFNKISSSNEEDRSFLTLMYNALHGLNFNESYASQIPALVKTFNLAKSEYPHATVINDVVKTFSLPPDCSPDWASKLIDSLSGIPPSMPQGQFAQTIIQWLKTHKDDPNLASDLAKYLNAQYSSPSSSVKNDLYFTFEGTTHEGLSYEDAREVYSILQSQGVQVNTPAPTDIDRVLFNFNKISSSNEEDRSFLTLMYNALHGLNFNESYASQIPALVKTFNLAKKTYPQATVINDVVKAFSLPPSDPDWVYNLMKNLSQFNSEMPQGQFAQTIIQWLQKNTNDPNLASDLAKYLNTQYGSPPSSIKNDLYFTFEGTTHEGLSYKDAQEVYSLLESSGVSVSTPAPTDIDQVLFNFNNISCANDSDRSFLTMMYNALDGLNFKESYASQISALVNTFDLAQGEYPFATVSNEVAKALSINM